MLCQRASLCPAETQGNKHQQTTKRSPWGWSYLPCWIATRGPSKCLTLLMIYAHGGQRATTPLLVPPTSRVHDPVTRHSPQAQHKGSVYFLQDLQCDLLNREFYSQLPRLSGLLSLSLSLNMHMHSNRDE